MRTGEFQTFLKGSKSIFEAIEEDKTEVAISGAGLSPKNTIHGFLCVNGDPKRPLMFANFLKNGAKQSLQEQKQAASSKECL